MSSSRRWPMLGLRLVGWLMVGAAMNAGAVYLCVAGAVLGGDPQVRPTTAAQRAWFLEHVPYGDVGPIEVGPTTVRNVDFGMDSVRISSLPVPRPDRPGRSAIEGVRYRAGWPLRCVDGVLWRRDASTRRWEYRGLVWVPSNPWGRRALLPLRPMWAGMAVNVVAAGVLAATAVRVVTAIAQAMVRWVRRRRGRCPGCAYPIGASARCSECGEALRPA
ncbi:MAG: hypothetical protein KDA25_04930 [Phycisphaerales bacterium]|nr:hypothetical protein [Phycisphaerales bacterium]